MKKLPLIIVPIVLAIIFFSSFIFLPQNADLISAQGDYYIGQALAALFLVCLILDWNRFFGNKKK